MGDLVHLPRPSNNFATINKTLTKSSPSTSFPNYIINMSSKHLRHITLEEGQCGKILLFLLKVAALEVLRRISKRRCPFVWNVLQALQVLIYPPFKWFQRWKLFRSFVKGMQVVSRPLLFLSVTTAFSEFSDSKKQISDYEEQHSGSAVNQHEESSNTETSTEMRISDEEIESMKLSNVHDELEKQGVTLPKRINDDELHRFYMASDGSISCLLQSIKKTIRWRETYNILTTQDLKQWSHLVFWHGYDVDLRPCLVIRFGLAYSTVAPKDRPRFSQAIVSQIEHGVLYMVKGHDLRITVLVDCQGLSPNGFPMQMMRSCSTLVQDHYPNRLANLFVIRLPPLAWDLAQAFLQVLNPTTQQKLQFLGETYPEVLVKYLQSFPSFLGGKCTCARCLALSTRTETQSGDSSASSDDDLEGSTSNMMTDDICYPSSYDQVLRTAVMGILFLWIVIAFMLGMHAPESLSSTT